MRRPFWCAAVVATLLSGAASWASSGPRWQVLSLVPANRHVEDAELAVSQNGAAALGWLQGKYQSVCFGGASCPKPPPWHGFRVMVAQGTVASGFGRPLELSAHARSPLYVAQLSSGVTYVAWTGYPHYGWRVVAIDDGHVSSQTLLPPNAQLLGLYSGRSRDAAAVWLTPASPAFLVHYAFLGPGGRLGRQGNISMITRQGTNPAIAVNDRGDLAVTWARGSQETIPMLALCDARGGCTTTQIALRTSPYIPPTVSLADDGTAAVLGGLQHLWSAVGRAGQRSLTVSRIAEGGRPVVTSDGRGGAVSIFNSAPDSLAWTFLSPAGTSFGPPISVPDSDTSNSAALSANLAGQFVAAWTHATGSVNPGYVLRASLGSGTHPGRPVALARPGQNAGVTTAVTGIDGHGDAIVCWERFSSHGTRGLFVATHIEPG